MASDGGLKESYAWQLRGFVFLNFAAATVVLMGLGVDGGVILNDWSTLWETPILAAVIVPLVTLVLDGLVPSEVKASLVFWRLRHPLPGSVAFTVHGPADARVDMAALEEAFGPLPATSAEQNQLWYSMSKRFGDQPSVRQAHRNYLMSRDLTSVAAVFLLVLGSVAVLGGAPLRWSYLALLGAQYLLLRQVAANYGRRFVRTVLAEASAGVD